MIEWMPRSRGDNGWSHVREEPHRGRAAVLDDADGSPVVRVPVVVQDWVRAALRHAGQLFVQLARMAFFLVMLVSWVVQAALHERGRTWPVLATAAVLLAVLLGLASYRLVRLRRWPSRGRRGDILIGAEGVAVDDVVVPWYQIERVVRFHFAAPATRRRTRNFLAVEVRDFVGVRGLTPMRAGLANLTRRRLFVLAETTELSHPDQLAEALDRLVADPSTRGLLTRSDGCRLVDEGPAMVIWRSP